jgi:hypothetical protein
MGSPSCSARTGTWPSSPTSLSTSS